MDFFIPIIPPTVTHQEKKISVRNGKPVVYEPLELKDARNKLMANICKYAPKKPFQGPVRLLVKWLFPINGKHGNGEWKTSKPDTDNLQKLLKDCMTDLGFWQDDAQVCSEVSEKFWAEMPGIYIYIEKLGGNDY